MIVEALCQQSCWDSEDGQYYYQGRVYSIDTDSAVAKLENCWMSDKFDFPRSSRGKAAATAAVPPAQEQPKATVSPKLPTPAKAK